MKRLLFVVALVLVGVGFYRGWFMLTSSSRPGSHLVDVNLSIDPDKVKSDAEQASALK